MDMFTLVSKLTLDKDEYDSALKQAESDASNIPDPTPPNLDLETHDFYNEVDNAEGVEVADPESPELDLDSQPFSDSLKDAESDTEDFEFSIGSILGNIKGLIAAAGIAAAIASVTSGLSEAVDLARSMGDNIDKSSRAMSLSTDAYQEWTHVMDINGASITDLNRGLMNMRKLMGGGEASKEFTEGMDKLGLSAKVANGEIKTTEELLDASLKALADYEGTDRDYIAQALFGRGGTKLNAMFDGTSKDIEDLKKQAHELGLVMSEEEIANAAAYNDAVTNMNQSITAFKTALVQDIIPGLTDAANLVAKIVAFFNPRNKQESIAEQWAGDDKKFAEELVTIESTSTAAETLADKLLKMGDTGKMTAEQYAIWKGTAEELIKLVPSLGEQIDLETGKINGNSKSIKDNIAEWENLAKQKALQTLKEEKYQSIVEKNADLINQSIEANKKVADAEGKRKSALDELNAVLTSHGLEALGEDSTFEDALKAQTDAILGFTGSEDQLASFSTEMSGAISAWTSAIAEANEAQKKADKLTEEIKKAEEEYEEWVAAANELYGITETQAEDATEDVEELNKALDELPTDKKIRISIMTAGMEDGPFVRPFYNAKGNWKIPYDNYPILGHRDERLLTASEARKMDSGSGTGVNTSEITEAVKTGIKQGMEGVSVNSYLNGREITDDVSRDTGRQLKARRFRK